MKRAMRMQREIVRIDEEKCDGCGLCVPACAEGAIDIVDGKARLSDEVLCDGIGLCLGECPQDAITIEKREAKPFDPDEVAKLAATKHEPAACQGSCPGAALRSMVPPSAGGATSVESRPSELRNWPVQLHLVPTNAPYLQGARLLIAADCVPFACADFHSELLAGQVLLIGCPKLDDGQAYLEKLTELFQVNDLESVTIAYMEVPCCFGLVQIIRGAMEAAGSEVPLILTQVSTQGAIGETVAGR
jgi:ferredoxin